MQKLYKSPHFYLACYFFSVQEIMCDDEFQYRFVSITMQFDKVCDRSVGKKKKVFTVECLVLHIHISISNANS